MRIQVSDPTLTDELIDFFRRRECRVERVERDVIEVEAHPTLTPERGRLARPLAERLAVAASGVELRSPRPRTRRPRTRE